MASQPRNVVLLAFPGGEHASFGDGLPFKVNEAYQAYEATKNDESGTEVAYETLISSWRYLSSNPTPAVLHVSKEARAEARKHYALDFGLKFDYEDENGSMNLRTTPKVYFNWSVDTLCLFEFDCDSEFGRGDPLTVDLLRRCVYNGLKSFAIEVTFHDASGIAEFCAMIPSLEQVYLFQNLKLAHEAPKNGFARTGLVDMEELRAEARDVARFRGISFDFGELVSDITAKDRLQGLRLDEYQDFADELRKEAALLSEHVTKLLTGHTDNFELDTSDASNVPEESEDDEILEHERDSDPNEVLRMGPGAKARSITTPLQISAMALWKDGKDDTIEYFKNLREYKVEGRKPCIRGQYSPPPSPTYLA